MSGLAEIHLNQHPEQLQQQLHHPLFGTVLREPEHGAIGDSKTDPALCAQGVWAWAGAPDAPRIHLRGPGFMDHTSTDPTKPTQVTSGPSLCT